VPALPTLTITDDQATRCLAAWGSVAAYKAWLASEVAGYVRASERATVLADAQDAALAMLAAIDDSDPLADAT
jgi:hypothetical protein